MKGGNLRETFCRLCISTIFDTNFQVIEEVITEVLKVVLPGVDLVQKDEHVICGTCSVKLFAALSFKSSCLDTEDIIFPYVTSEVSLVDLKEVYLKEKENIQLISISESQKICRLCFQLVTSGFVSVNEVDVDIINKYIPQVNLNATKDPVICELCLNSLHTHGNFVKNCLGAQEPYEQSYINKEVLDIKLEDDYESDYSHDLFEGTISNSKRNHALRDSGEIIAKCILQCEDEQVRMVECKSEIKKNKVLINTPSTEGEHGNKLKGELKHEDVSKVQMYKCGKCKYETKYKGNLKLHERVHRGPSESRMYKCDECSFKTKYKASRNVHKLQHKDPSEKQMHKCDVCGYKTNIKNRLQLHQLKHKDPSEVQMYKCDECSFETKYKSYIKCHQMTHKDPSEIRMYKCDACSYETKSKSHLKRHQLIHKAPSEVQMYKCDTCSYEAKQKVNIKLHQLKHKDPSEVQMYKCDVCSFETKYRKGLKKHQLTHKSPSEIQMYTCYTCGFETKRKKGLQRHQLIHRKQPKTRKN